MGGRSTQRNLSQVKIAPIVTTVAMIVYLAVDPLTGAVLGKQERQIPCPPPG